MSNTNKQVAESSAYGPLTENLDYKFSNKEAWFTYFLKPFRVPELWFSKIICNDNNYVLGFKEYKRITLVKRINEKNDKDPEIKVRRYSRQLNLKIILCNYFTESCMCVFVCVSQVHVCVYEGVSIHVWVSSGISIQRLF